jgi:biotin carboxyl carrier protein
VTLADDELDALGELVELFAEDLDVRERLITAPRPGRFFPAVAYPPHPHYPEGVPVRAGQRIGVVVRTGEEHHVTCAFSGMLMGLMVLPGERVRLGQPVAWLVISPPG